MVKRILLTATVFLVIIITASVLIMRNVTRKFEAYMSNLIIEDIDFTEVEDGTYYGESDSGIIKVRLGISVSGGKVTEINILEHRTGKGEPAESITGDIIDNQSLLVDTVSGATYSSLVILDAVQNSLKGSSE